MPNYYDCTWVQVINYFANAANSFKEKMHFASELVKSLLIPEFDYLKACLCHHDEKTEDAHMTLHMMKCHCWCKKINTFQPTISPFSLSLLLLFLSPSFWCLVTTSTDCLCGFSGFTGCKLAGLLLIPARKEEWESLTSSASAQLHKKKEPLSGRVGEELVVMLERGESSEIHKSTAAGEDRLQVILSAFCLNTQHKWARGETFTV